MYKRQAPNSGPGAGPTGQLLWTDLTGPLGELLPGAGVEVLVNFQAKADTTAEAGTVTVNTATVSGITADPDGAAGPAPRFPDPLPPQSAQAPVGIVNPTATLLSGGQALLTAAGVGVSWQTVSEVNVAGFNLLRVGLDGGAVRLNDTIIPAQKSGQAEGATYGWVDTTESDRRYELEIIRLDGSTVRADLGRAIIQIYLPVINR